MKTQTDKKIGEEAVKSLKQELEAYGKERARNAQHIAEEDGRKTLQKEDLIESR